MNVDDIERSVTFMHFSWTLMTVVRSLNVIDNSEMEAMNFVVVSVKIDFLAVK